ncbi:MAG: SIMPL domain-containing protein [Patescibacteria group bacterium]
MSPLQKFILSLIGIMVIGGVLVAGAVRMGKGLSRIEVSTAEPQDHFSVSAEGKVSARPDIAVMSFGVVTERTTVAQATKENTDAMNTVIAAVKGQKVEEKDIKTSQYQLNPIYEYPPNGRSYIRGYRVSQQVDVKVRDFDTIGEVIAVATSAGANEVGSLQFTIDEPDVLKAQARKEAIEKARNKAREIADESGLKLGRLINVSESGVVPPPVPLYDRAYMMEAKTAAPVAPEIQAGEQEITATVTLIYEVE